MKSAPARTLRGTMPHQYQSVDAALVRVAAASIAESLPPWPDVTGDTSEHIRQWRHWLERIWKQEPVSEAIEVASPILAWRVQSICDGADLPARDMRRAVLSVARYGLRMTGRATPFGLFAGVTPARFGNTSEVRWGGRHRVVTRADAVWLATVIGRLEMNPDLLRRLSVKANNLGIVRGDRLAILHQQMEAKNPGVLSEVSVRRTRPVESVAALARSPISVTTLIDTLAVHSVHGAQQIEKMVTDLISCGILLTSLRPPMTVIDALGHVVDHLTTVDADGIPALTDEVRELRAIHLAVRRHNSARSPSFRQVRKAVAQRMSTLCDRTEQPLVVDLRVDGALVLSERIAHEAQRATSALLRLTSRPWGAPAWQAYYARFLDRYGVGALVPILDLVNEETGLGFPAGFRGSHMTPPPATLTARDLRLLKLAQQAALDGSHEIVLSDRTIDEIAADRLAMARLPPHLELCCQIHAPTLQALDRGDFRFVVVSVSRAAGTTTGRFLHLLDSSDHDRMTSVYAGLPTAESAAGPVQISCPPLTERGDNVARVSAIQPDIISLGEYRPEGDSSVPIEDLAVSADARRLYLMSMARQQLVEPTVPHAVEFRNHTHPLARFLCEITTAQSAAAQPFSWGAASALPFLPRVRYGLTVLSPARWNLDAFDLPARNSPDPEWNRGFSQLQRRLHIPDGVVLGTDDRRLRLDLSVPLHRALVHSDLKRTGRAVLHEAPDPTAFGWCDGRPHEVVLPLARTAPPAENTHPTRRTLRTLGRDHGHLPGASKWLFVKLYGIPDQQVAILTTRLPGLLDMWDDRLEWWYVRYHDPEPHLRLRLRLTGWDAKTYGEAMHRVGVWATELRRVGLMTRLQIDTYYPETGRFGIKSTMDAAESVFAADSVAAVEELRYAAKSAVHLHALVAVSLVDLAANFFGSLSQGMSWLISEMKANRPSPPPSREIRDQAIRLTDAHDDWPTLRATPSGDLVADAWRSRRARLTGYRDKISVTGDVEPASVLPALLHLHHLRTVGPDPDSERLCQRLARALALRWDQTS